MEIILKKECEVVRECERESGGEGERKRNNFFLTTYKILLHICFYFCIFFILIYQI